MTTRQNTQGRLVSKAATDPAFRAALLRDPHTAISDEIGEIPPGITINVVEETPHQIYIVVPSAPSDQSELTDEELASADGGAGRSYPVGGQTECFWGANTCHRVI